MLVAFISCACNRGYTDKRLADNVHQDVALVDTQIGNAAQPGRRLIKIPKLKFDRLTLNRSGPGCASVQRKDTTLPILPLSIRILWRGGVCHGKSADYARP